MKAVLLGAGFGTRLAPLTATTPKLLIPVADEPLLARQLRYLETCGVDEIALNVHHLGEQIEEFLRANPPQAQVHVFREESILGTAGALLPMRDLLDEPFLVLYGDVVTDADLADLRRHLRGIATLAYYVSDDIRGKGLLDIDDAGRIVGFMEKPDAVSGARPVNAGVYVLDPSILRYIPEQGDFGHDVWPVVTRAGEAIYGHQLSGYLRDMGSHQALARLEQDIAAGSVRW